MLPIKLRCNRLTIHAVKLSLVCDLLGTERDAPRTDCSVRGVVRVVSTNAADNPTLVLLVAAKMSGSPSLVGVISPERIWCHTFDAVLDSLVLDCEDEVNRTLTHPRKPVDPRESDEMVRLETSEECPTRAWSRTSQRRISH